MFRQLNSPPCSFWLFIVYCLLSTVYCPAQHFSRTDTIKVTVNSKSLKFPWAGGHDYCQFSDVDINQDGKKDLFVFDRSGNKVSTYINKGTPNTVDYLDSTFKYASKFPPLELWALMIDYNCDGKEDIFTSSINPSGIRVYKNTSTAGNLQFTLAKDFLKAGTSFIPANSIGLPAITDLDNDSDLDILTFTPGNFMMSYYVNQSKEVYNKCDSLVFSLAPGCYAHFSEGGSGSCSVALTACKIRPPDSTVVPFNGNGSSCSLCLDMDGDGDKELLLGQGNCCTTTLLTNGGGPGTAANITAFTSNFPAGGPYVNMRYNPCGFFVDVNNDSKRDLLVATSMQNISLNNESIWYYQNTGADNAPVFSRKTRSFLQEDMIDAGQGADPVFFDFDNDGLTDLLVSNFIQMNDSCPATFSYGVFAYKNTGTSASPKFQLVNTDYANLSTELPNITNKHLTFGDVDGDGDQDMFVGDYDGFLHYFENTASTGNPASFVLSSPINYQDAAANTIDVGSNAAPQLIDVDRDTRLDLIIGKRAGTVSYYRNIGTTSVPSFQLVSTKFGGVDVMSWGFTGYSVPFMYNFGGSYRMLVGSQANRQSGTKTGWIWQYDNIDGNLGGNFNRVDSLFQNIWEGLQMTIAGKDITNDGKTDIVIGNLCGGAVIYLGDTLTTGIDEPSAKDFDFEIFPNPAANQSTVYSLQSARSKNYTLQILNMLGEILWEETLNNPRETINFNLPEGIYFCRISMENFSKTKKLVVMQ